MEMSFNEAIRCVAATTIFLGFSSMDSTTNEFFVAVITRYKPGFPVMLTMRGKEISMDKNKHRKLLMEGNHPPISSIN
jgi:hypothetical protein